MNKSRIVARHFLKFTCVWLILFAVCALVPSMPDPLWYFDETQTFRISDFAYYLTFVREFWFGENVRLYAVSTHPEILSRLVGSDVQGGMPLAILPTALILWWPLAWFPPASFGLAYRLYISLSLSLLLTALFYVFAEMRRKMESPAVILIPTLFVFFGSSSFLLTFVLGQSSLLAVAALITAALMLWNEEGESFPWFVVALVFVLSFKVHYLIAGVLLLLGFRRYKLLLQSLVVVAIGAALLTLELGLVWISDYYQSMSLFLSTSKPALVASSFVQEKMIILESVLAPWLGAHNAKMLGSGLFLSLLISGMWLGLKDRKTALQLHSPRSFAPLVFYLSAYLLFAPYLGRYEDLLLFVPWLVLALSLPSKPPFYQAFGSAVLLCVVWNHVLLLSFIPLWIFWIGKAFLLASFCFATVRSESPRHHRSPQSSRFAES